MHRLIRHILYVLSNETRIPSDVLLVCFECRPKLISNDGTSTSDLSIQARRDGIYYKTSSRLSGTQSVEMTLTFLLPRIPKPLKTSFSPQGQGKSFSLYDIATYLQYSGDENPIHKDDFPIVPGLLIANWLLTTQFNDLNQFRMRFKNPLFSNQRVVLEETGDYFTLFHHQTPILEVHL